MRTFRTILAKLVAVIVIASLSNGTLAHLFAWLHLHLGIYGIIFGFAIVAMSSNSEKARTVESRITNTVMPMLSNHSEGIFRNVDVVGNLAQLTGSGTMHADALSFLSSPSTTSFLATLRGVSVPSSPAAAPSSYNQSWGQNITGVINTMIAFLGQSGIW